MSKKTFTVEKIADSFLVHLATRDIPTNAVSMHKFLDTKDVFYDYELIIAATDLLIERGYAVSDPNSHSIIGFTGGLMPKDDRRVPRLIITEKGKSFALAGQKVDLKGREERQAEAKKNKDRWIAAAIGIGVAVITMFIKWLLFDRK